MLAECRLGQFESILQQAELHLLEPLRRKAEPWWRVDHLAKAGCSVVTCRTSRGKSGQCESRFDIPPATTAATIQIHHASVVAEMTQPRAKVRGCPEEGDSVGEPR